MLANILSSIIQSFLKFLNRVFRLTRKKSVPAYPFDKSTNTITLPQEIEKELLDLISSEGKVEAVKWVTKLTGAGLRVSKDYVDNLIETKGRG
jgi:ribosomal protein L7/L12